MTKQAFQKRLKLLQRQHQKLIRRPNRAQKLGNGIFESYEFPGLTTEHTP